MYFTQGDFEKIEKWLQSRTVKDTQFPRTSVLSGEEQVAIIQDGKNKVIDLNLIKGTSGGFEFEWYIYK